MFAQDYDFLGATDTTHVTTFAEIAVNTDFEFHHFLISCYYIFPLGGVPEGRGGLSNPPLNAFGV